MDRRRHRDILVNALDWAIQDRLAFADAHANCDDKIFEETNKNIIALRKMRKKITGFSDSDLNRYLSTLQSVSVQELHQQASGE